MNLDQLKEESRRIRKLRNLVFSMFLGFPFFGAALFLISTQVGISEVLVFLALIPYVIVYLILGFRISEVICPVCNEAMFRNGIFYGLGYRCQHCNYDLKDYKTSKFHGNLPQN